MVKESVPATAEEGKSIEPGQGALSSPHGEVPVGSPILTDPTLPLPDPVGSATAAVLAALLPVPRPLAFPLVNPAPISSQLSPRIVAPFTAIDEAKNITRSGVLIIEWENYHQKYYESRVKRSFSQTLVQTEKVLKHYKLWVFASTSSKNFEITIILSQENFKSSIISKILDQNSPRISPSMVTTHFRPNL